MATYTFVANYGLGTYLDQREGASHGAAVQSYARESDFAFLKSIDETARNDLKRSLLSCKVEQAGTLRNVWSCAVPVENDVFILSVVQSAQEPGAI